MVELRLEMQKYESSTLNSTQNIVRPTIKSIESIILIVCCIESINVFTNLNQRADLRLGYFFNE